MKEKLITSQRTVYDDIQQHSSNKVSDFPISAKMRKSFNLSHQRYKDDLEKNKKEAVESDFVLKWKAKDEEIQKVTQKILGIESCIKSLREEVFKQTLLADEKQDLVCAAKAASFCRTLKEKEETRKELVIALKKLEEEYELSKTYTRSSSNFAFYLFSSDIQVFVQLEYCKV